MFPRFPETINHETMTKFLLDMKKHNLLYHIDDDPRSIYSDITGKPLFSVMQSYALLGFFASARSWMTWEEIWDCFPFD